MYGSTEEKKCMRPGHNWLSKFADAGDEISCKKQFNLTRAVWRNSRGPGSPTASKLLWSSSENYTCIYMLLNIKRHIIILKELKRHIVFLI